MQRRCNWRTTIPTPTSFSRGDTLWGISNKFLRNPWEWPEVWQANTQIPNPHLIYPGQVLNLAYVNGRPRVMNGGFGPHVRAEPLDEAIKPMPLSAIEDFLKKPRMVGEDEFRSAPHVRRRSKITTSTARRDSSSTCAA